jgi:hypothetical protein
MTLPTGGPAGQRLTPSIITLALTGSDLVADTLSTIAQSGASADLVVDSTEPTLALNSFILNGNAGGANATGSNLELVSISPDAVETVLWSAGYRIFAAGLLTLPLPSKFVRLPPGAQRLVLRGTNIGGFGVASIAGVIELSVLN